MFTFSDWQGITDLFGLCNMYTFSDWQGITDSLSQHRDVITDVFG